MELLQQFIDYFVHIDVKLAELAASLGLWTYLILFLVIFCETGLVVTPFLPGDSLLFAAGALVTVPGAQLSLPLLLVLLFCAAVLGDAVNYGIGYKLGPKVFKYENSRLLNRKHLLRAHAFYETYGGKTIFLARFIPIIRTFAPFVAGIGAMRYRHFAIYNVVGAAAWVLICALCGYFFGGMEWVQKNFSAVILAIVAISVLPIVIEFILARRRRSLLVPGPAEAEST